jgi:TolB-like protein/tetratricopeptide (TPR) repeat protein
MNTMVGGRSDGHILAPVSPRPEYTPAAHPVARIHLFGPMRATSYLGDDILPRGKKARALLGYLCLAVGDRVPRERLTKSLWQTSPVEQARHSFRQRLRELTEAMGPFAAELIDARTGTVRLNVNACWIDALALLEPSWPADKGFADLCRGELLEGLDGISTSFDRWLAAQRIRAAERLRTLAAVAIRSSVRRVTPTQQPQPQPPLPGRNRLRVAVLPFTARGDREEELAFSLSHQIGAALARFRWFDVISSVRAGAQPLLSSDALLSRELDYAVEGAVSRHGNQVVINIRLLDLARASQPVWSERFELKASDLPRLDELVTPRVVASIDPVILFIEGQPKRRAHYGATGLLLLALPLFYSMEREKFERAGELIKRAVKLDPKSAMALAWSAFWHITCCAHGWATFHSSMSEAEAASRKAIDLDRENAEALAVYAHTCAWKKEFERAVECFDRSLRLNPNLGFAWWLSAATYCYISDPNEALRRLTRCRKLGSLDPHSAIYENIYSIAYTLKGDYEQAVLIGRNAVKLNPNFPAAYKPLIAALGHLGRAEEAKPYIARLLALEPNFTVEGFNKVYPIKNATDRERYMKGLRLAGVPER